MLIAGFKVADKVTCRHTQVNKGYCYFLNDGEMIVFLEVNQQSIDTIFSAQPKKEINF